MSWILTNSGRHVSLLDPQPEQIEIGDIATSLSRECRFAGQTRLFYSVAQHSVMVSRECVGFEIEGLLHDAAEAYLRDIPQPLKELLPRYREIEANLTCAIRARYSLPMVNHKLAVMKHDLRVLATERRDLMPKDPDYPWPCLASVKPLPSKIIPWSADDAKTVFLDTFFYLVQDAPR